MPTIQGTAASEALSGAEGADTVVGGAGHDTLDDGLEFLGWGMAVGADLLLGGDGNDILYGYDGADTLSGGNGQDELWSLTDADTLLGGAGLDTAVIDRSLTDIGITFAAPAPTEAELAFGRDGLVLSGIERFRLFLGSGADQIVTRGAADELLGGAGNDTLNGGGGDDRIDGGWDDDSLLGGGGNDWIAGDGGQDTLRGGAGDDTLLGGEGRDLLAGGEGADSFLFYDSAEGPDRIADFTPGEDLLVVNGAMFSFNLAAGPLDPAWFVANAGGVPTRQLPGEGFDSGQFAYDTLTGRLHFDLDGAHDGFAPVLVAVLLNRPELSAADIQVLG